MKTIRCGRGLGDSIYLQSVVRHLVERGYRLKVRSDFPDVFRPLAGKIEVAPFSRHADITAHYADRKGTVGTTQFEDCCHNAGIREPVDLRLDWIVTNPALVARVLAPGKPVAVVQLPRSPMGRTDGFGAELLPDCAVLQRLVDGLKATHTVVQVGAGAPLYRFTGIDIDLANATTVAEMIDVAAVADRFLGYCSFLVPLAESFGKPAVFVWSARGLRAGHRYVRQITPRKVLHRPTSTFVLDEERPPSMKFIDRETLRSHFKGKRVALVGSGPGALLNEPGFVDSHDVVVRVNNFKTFPATGFRTDVFYSFFGSSISKTADELKADGVTLCMCKCPDAQFIDSEWHKRHAKMNGVDFSYIYEARRDFWFCDTYVPPVEDFLAQFELLGKHVPTTGFSALLDVLAQEPASLFLTGFDFFESGVHNVNEPWRRKNVSDPIGHVPAKERAWLEANLDRHPIQLDGALSKRLGRA